MRARGYSVLDFDPEDGGCNARALFLLHTPGPEAKNSGFVSRDNLDPTAQNMGRAMDDAKLQRCDVLLWNAVPYIAATTDDQTQDARADTQALIDKLPNLRAIVFCGFEAIKVAPYLQIPFAVRSFFTFHTGAQAYNHHHEKIHYTFRQVAQHLRQ
jgi:hypothetical protein